ncbi:MAG: phage terminase large subunit [Chloroflexi bacterium]|nr:phage terminase large subunit [Chloroflexota bacterium]MCY3588393.1 phage terminase large subunit [Chloroflexota bacterium]MCY3686889.1 phage terminase large subunit [Chloroflexota bacterium]MDE2709319.1 phage terminase large subunit [Chloroflexota bacterium]
MATRSLSALEPQEQRFTPTARQLAVYDALRQTPAGGTTLVGYGGAMGGGKTRAIAELAIDTALSYPGTNILVARQHYSDLQTTTMREFFECLPERLIVGRQRSAPQWVSIRDVAWPGGVSSTIHFRHLSEWTGLGSEQYGAVFVDEAGEVAEEAAQMLLTRLRHPAQPQRWFVAASNPWPGWFERWFARRELDESAFAEAAGRIVYIPARIPDNPHLPDNYAAQQQALQPGEWVQRFIEGRFDAFEGQIYPDFDPRRQLWDAPLPPFARYIGGLDFGGQSPRDHYTAGVVAGITSNRAPCGPNVLIRLGEFEDRGPGVTERLEQWQHHWQRKLGPIQWCADRSQSAWIDHQRRQGHRVVPSKGGPDSLNWGISLVQQRLSQDPPGSYYTPPMHRFPERMREYQWDLKSGEQSPKPKKLNDDLLDADRYMHELTILKPFRTGTAVITTKPRGQIARHPD